MWGRGRAAERRRSFEKERSRGGDEKKERSREGEKRHEWEEEKWKETGRGGAQREEVRRLERERRRRGLEDTRTYTVFRLSEPSAPVRTGGPTK